MLRSPILPALMIPFALVAQDAPKAPVTRLSLQGAIETALKNNLQVQIATETRTSTRAGVTVEEGSFDWNLSSGLTLSKTQDGVRSQSSSGLFTTLEGTTQSRSLSVGSTKAFEWGGNLSLNYAPRYSFSSGSLYGGSTSMPYDGSLSATYTQSLLRNFGREVAESRLVVARLGAQAADYTYQLSIINLVASTESQYWDVVYAQRNLANKRQALELSQRQLRENRIRVEVGTLAPIEVTSSEASVAQAEQDIITAEANLANAKDTLIRALFPGGERPGALELTDAPTIGHITLDEAAAERMALDRRVELKSAQVDLKSKKVLEVAANNRTLPQLDAFATYSGAAASQVPSEGLAAVNKDLSKAAYPGYSIGLQFSMPIQNRAARGSQAQARASRRTSELSLQDQELAIRLQVRQAIRNVEAAEKGVKATEKTRIFREKDLDAERKKFENGMSTNFLVLSKLNDLNTSMANELQSQINYAKSVTSLEQAVGNLLEARKLVVK